MLLEGPRVSDKGVLLIDESSVHHYLLLPCSLLGDDHGEHRGLAAELQGKYRSKRASYANTLIRPVSVLD